MDDLTENLSSLLQVLYQAPGNNQAWSDFITQFTRSMGADQGLFVHIDSQNQHTNLANTYNFEEEYLRSYEEYYQFLNPYIALSMCERPTQGSYGLLNQLIPDKEVKKTEFYNDYVLPQNLTVCNAIMLTPFESDEVHTSIALHYKKNNDGGHVEQVLKTCKIIMPHLQNSLRLHRKIQGLQARMHFFNEAIDNNPFGIILLDSKLSILEINETANKLIVQNDGLSIRNRRLETHLPAQTNKLSELLNAALGNRLGSTTSFNNSFQVVRKSGKLPYELLVTPILEQKTDCTWTDCAVAMFVNDPELINPSIDKVLKRLYRLTGTETQVTMQLIKGSSSQEICESLKIGRETFKSHLKNIFKKTHTHKQSELVSFILRCSSLAHHQLSF